MSSIVAVENHNRVFKQFFFCEFRCERSDCRIHVLDHVGDVAVLLRLLDVRIPSRRIRCRFERPVRKRHRVIDKGRLVFVFIEEVDDFVDPNIFSVFTRVGFDFTFGSGLAFKHRRACVA